MIHPPIAKRICAITSGCATSRANLVAVEAEAQRMAKIIPAPTHLNCMLMANDLLFKNAKLMAYKEKAKIHLMKRFIT
ncbi:MAG: hypothetical protein ABIN48_00135 [Ginsengibacter sp.]